jgi:hypothetical protein
MFHVLKGHSQRWTSGSEQFAVLKLTLFRELLDILSKSLSVTSNLEAGFITEYE